MERSIQGRAKKIQDDLSLFQSAIPKKFIKKWGNKGYAVAYICLSIQKQAIIKDKNISLPSLETFKLAFNVSTRHSQRIINELIKSGSLHIKNFYKVDQNGEIVTYDHKGFKFRKTKGLLRKIINPFSKVTKIMKSKTTRTQKSKELTSTGWSRFIQKYIDINPLVQGLKPRGIGYVEPLSLDPPPSNQQKISDDLYDILI